MGFKPIDNVLLYEDIPKSFNPLKVNNDSYDLLGIEPRALFNLSTLSCGAFGFVYGSQIFR